MQRFIFQKKTGKKTLSLQRGTSTFEAHWYFDGYGKFVSWKKKASQQKT